MKRKIIAFYLPQFHEIPENNDAWGKGFTEWVNVKKAKPLFWGHNQPRVPLNKNYYCLDNPKVMEEQISLAKQYGIYGFCFYHYWFKGKKVLEKPVEKMLHNENANMPYCFAWANEAWTKTWHGAGGEKEVLIRQTYGTQTDWQDHYRYLRHFFNDINYIKKDNKPILLIYKINNMRHRSEMFEYFNKSAIDDGFDGIYIIQMLSNEDPKSKLKWINGYVDFEPAHIRNMMRQNAKKEKVSLVKQQLSKMNIFNRWTCDILDYEKVCNELICTEHASNYFRGLFVDYDDSPRRGKKALIFKNVSPKKFGVFLQKSIEKSQIEGNEYIFINAWNEWGEGAYLEPDEKNGYSYLEEIRRRNL